MKSLIGILVLASSLSAFANEDVLDKKAKTAVEASVLALFGNTSQVTDAFALGSEAADNAVSTDWDVTLNTKPELTVGPGYQLTQFSAAAVIADVQAVGEMAAILNINLVGKGSEEFALSDYKTAAKVSVVQLFGTAKDMVEVTELSGPTEVEGVLIADYEVSLNDFSGPAAGSIVYTVQINKFLDLVQGQQVASIYIELKASN